MHLDFDQACAFIKTTEDLFCKHFISTQIFRPPLNLQFRDLLLFASVFFSFIMFSWYFNSVTFFEGYSFILVLCYCLTRMCCQDIKV